MLLYDIYGIFANSVYTIWLQIISKLNYQYLNVCWIHINKDKITKSGQG